MGLSTRTSPMSHPPDTLHLMVLTERRMTADEFLALPREPHTQLIDGEIVVTKPRLRHQRIVAELYRLLANWLIEHPGHGEAGFGCDVRLDEYNVFEPDVWWVSQAHRPPGDAAFFQGPPGLVVEVRSPSTWRYDIGKKKATYERSGLAELWLVDTAADVVFVFRRSSPRAAAFDVELEIESSENLATPMLPGFEVDLTSLFDR
jgi:Uma2 family endonuclease